jgi:putative transposase
MARLARVVAVDVAHHVTQRGNARQFILSSDAERKVYLDLLRQALQHHPVSLAGYCLMSNHVHLVAIPRKEEAMAKALKYAHGRYAAYWNGAHASSGHVWQGRFYSCPLDEGHLWEALRYAELNPVRVRMVPEATQWKWSSAAAHCGECEPESFLDMELWKQHWSSARWREFLNAGATESELAAIRKCTHTGRPLGSTEFIKTLEQHARRQLAPRRGGRPVGSDIDRRQGLLEFES